MYEKKIFILFFISVCFVSCKSTKDLPGDGSGTSEYRELQSEIRDGETELAVAGAKLESTSERIEESVRYIAGSSERLERQLAESENEEQGIGEILQRIRERELTEDELNCIGIKF